MFPLKYLLILCLVCAGLLCINLFNFKLGENIQNPISISLKLKLEDSQSDFDLSIMSENEIEFNFDYEKLKNKFNLSDRYLFGLPFISSDYKFKHIFGNLSDFRWNSLPIKSNNNGDNAIPTNSIKCGDIIYIKTDYITNFFNIYHPKITHPYILITHESDYSVGTPQQLKMLDDPKIIVWFAENIIAKHPKLRPLPIGVVAQHGEKFTTIQELARNPIPNYSRKNLIYINFSPKTNKNREKTKKYFKNIFGNNSKVLFVENRIGWKNYLENMGNSQFVLSPPGNGIDCHRTWEALIMGSVPIVMKSELLPLYENMPIMVVNNWNEVTEENLRKFQKDKLKNFNRPKLWLRYWINEIMSIKQNYVENYC